MFELSLSKILLTVFVILLCNISYYTIKIYNLRKKFAHIPGPPATGLIGFYLGNVLEIRNFRNNDQLLMHNIVEWFESVDFKIILRKIYFNYLIRVNKYGKTIKFQVLDKFVIHTIDLQAIKDILIDSNYDKEPILYNNFGYPYGIRFIGQGLVTG